MIALDASTVLQSFREGTYDIKELGEKLQALCSSTGTVVFKYADGSVLMFPSASLVTHLTPYFAALSLAGGIGLAPHNGALAVYGDEKPGALSALFQTLEASTLSIAGSHIAVLNVSGDCSIGDLSAWARANSLQYASMGAASAKIGSVVAQDVSSPSGGLQAFVPDPLDHSVAAFAAKAQVQGEVARKPQYGLAEPNTWGLYRSGDYWAGHIILTSQSMSLELPRREASSGYITAVTFRIPYHTSAGWEYLPVDSYEVYRDDAPQVVPAQGAMCNFLLWPQWSVQRASAAACTFTALPGDYRLLGPAPVVRVENLSGSALELPHVWAFAKGDDGRGKATVLHKVKVAPNSCKEFEFRYSLETNCGYMYPLSAWY